MVDEAHNTVVSARYVLLQELATASPAPKTFRCLISEQRRLQSRIIFAAVGRLNERLPSGLRRDRLNDRFWGALRTGSYGAVSRLFALSI